MSMSKSIKSVLLLLTIVTACVASAAVPWFANGPKREIRTLIITGNYKSPRLLAELIQYESRQPYILLPSLNDENKQFIFCPPKGTSLPIREEKFDKFVRFINPRRIIVLGNEAYAPAQYIDMLDKAIPILRIESTNWYRVAEELTELLHLSNLDSSYRKLREQMLDKGEIYTTSKPKPKMPAKEVLTEQNPKDSAVEPAPAAEDLPDPAPKAEEIPQSK